MQSSAGETVPLHARIACFLLYNKWTMEMSQVCHTSSTVWCTYDWIFCKIKLLLLALKTIPKKAKYSAYCVGTEMSALYSWILSKRKQMFLTFASITKLFIRCLHWSIIKKRRDKVSNFPTDIPTYAVTFSHGNSPTPYMKILRKPSISTPLTEVSHHGSWILLPEKKKSNCLVMNFVWLNKCVRFQSRCCGGNSRLFCIII